MQSIMRRPVLVLLAGLLSDAEVWKEVASRLQEKADIKICSFPGFSSIAAMADHVLSSVQGPFALAGHSMGGRVALEIVRKAPSRVSALALLNTGVHPPAAHEPESRGRLVDLARESGMASVARQWLPPMLGKSTDRDSAVLGSLMEMVERSSPESLAAQTKALLDRRDAAPVLATLQVPVTLISATEDSWSPPKQHQAMRQLCPGAELVVIERAGHMAPAERPEDTANALAALLARLQARQASDQSMTDMERLQIAHRCSQQVYRLARLTDAGAWDAVCAIFSEDASLVRPSAPEAPLRGRTEIYESFTSRPPKPTKHSITGVETTIESSDRAVLVSSITMYSGSPGEADCSIVTTAVGSYVDTFVRDGGEWLIKERQGRIAMKSAH